MEMNEHQHRLWLRMLTAIERYKEDLITLQSLVGELQGAMDAAEFRDSEVTAQFYELWTPLEIDNAVLGGDVRYGSVKSVRREVNAMRRFLLERLGKS